MEDISFIQQYLFQLFVSLLLVGWFSGSNYGAMIIQYGPGCLILCPTVFFSVAAMLTLKETQTGGHRLSYSLNIAYNYHIIALM